MLMKLAAVQLLFLAVNAVFNMKAKDKGNIFIFNFLLSTAYLIYFYISIHYLIDKSDVTSFFTYIIVTLCICSTNFYASDFIKYMKDKENTALSQKTLKSAAVNHLIFAVMILVVLYFKNKYAV